MKILHLITTIERGGAENQLVTLVEQQIKLGNEVEVIYLKGSPELSELLGAAGAIITHRFSNTHPLSQLLNLEKFLKNYNSIVHCHLPRAELLGALLTIRCKNLALVISRHNAEKFFPKAPRLFSSWLARFVTKRAKKGIAISDAVADYNYRNSESAQGFIFEKIFYGYQSSRVKSPMQAENVVKLPTGKFVYGTIARLVPQKNISILLQAFAKIESKTREESRLCIVGSGFLEEKLKKEAFDLGIQNRVIWIPRTADVKEYLQQMDVFILPSNYEGFGLVLLEAMDSGVPIIGANNTAIAEVLVENAGRLFETGNVEDLCAAMTELRKDSILRSYISAGKARLDFFSPILMTQEVIEVYRSALSNK
jgi:glycosyltransferase involved in cell wall biosynthesis